MYGLWTPVIAWGKKWKTADSVVGIKTCLVNTAPDSFCFSDTTWKEITGGWEWHRMTVCFGVQSCWKTLRWSLPLRCWCSQRVRERQPIDGKGGKKSSCCFLNRWKFQISPRGPERWLEPRRKTNIPLCSLSGSEAGRACLLSPKYGQLISI